MVLRSLYILLVITLVACSDSQERLPDGTLVVNGAKLYANNCANCHGSKGDLGVGGAANLGVTNLTNAQLIETISKGKNTMQAFGTNYGGYLSVAEIEAIAAHIENTILH